MDAESMKNACDIALASMIQNDEADIYRICGHDFIANYGSYMCSKDL